jgi:hypothetical protein
MGAGFSLCQVDSTQLCPSVRVITLIYTFLLASYIAAEFSLQYVGILAQGKHSLAARWLAGHSGSLAEGS